MYLKNFKNAKGGKTPDLISINTVLRWKVLLGIHAAELTAISSLFKWSRSELAESCWYTNTASVVQLISRQVESYGCLSLGPKIMFLQL